jgi:hypothetical protein
MEKIILSGTLADQLLEYIDEKNAQNEIDSFSHTAKFIDPNPREAGAMEFGMLIIDFVKDVGVEVLAGLIVEFILSFKKVEPKIQSGGVNAPKQELKIKKRGVDIDLYSCNYSAEELKIILEDIANPTKDIAE